MVTKSHGAGVAQGMRRSLEATKVYACKACNAPGVWKMPRNQQERDHLQKWPGVLIDEDTPEKPDGKPVGETCPNCGASRDGLFEDLGEIWYTWVIGGPLWWRITHRFKTWWKYLRKKIFRH